MASTVAPALVLEKLSPWQRAGTSCCWCSDTASARYPVPLLSTVRAALRACPGCAEAFDIPAVEVPR
ncbi:hypothetical protein [Streptomyces sp. XD-27]|uniref:hypothetical protein n=1 Tax=Streptomyces sp. XD-27 TaxID=3062779 RepID=UPI0026F468BF|nr:hypothetical protein [Streptomyces sp. XD-27]WKX73593.1 hypothetical protein Q3Y56_30190 [Streptomyces sp. XD-27]